MNADRLLLQEKAAFAKVEAPCPYFGACGGCSIQDLGYADQLTLKHQRLLRALGTIDPTLPVEVVGTEDPWRYRNKAEFTFGEAEGRLILGYHAARSFWRLVDIDDCLLLPESVTRVLRDVRRLAQQTGRPAYHPRTHQGFFRHCVIRTSYATGQLMVCLVTTTGDRQVIEELARALRERHPDVASVYWGLNTRMADVAMPEELFLITGAPYVQDQIGPFTVQLHPFTFLQPAPRQAERLYTQVTQWVSDAPEGVAWDLYCGIGLLAFYVASKFRLVHGLDVEARNLDMAQLNATANGIANVQFHRGKAEDLLRDKRFWLTQARPDVVVLDPPRCGIHRDVASSLLAARPKQLVYVSCNLNALVRDLALLTTGFPRYRLSQVKAFDLFPHTNHLEILALLERR